MRGVRARGDALSDNTDHFEHTASPSSPQKGKIQVNESEQGGREGGACTCEERERGGRGSQARGHPPEALSAELTRELLSIEPWGRGEGTWREGSVGELEATVPHQPFASAPDLAPSRGSHARERG